MNEDQICALVIDRLKADSGFVAVRREWGVLGGVVIADVAALDGDGLHLVEVKTERDDLRRLALQADYYSRVAAKCSVVVAPQHLQKAMEIVPPWWGVLVAEDGALIEKRDTGINPVRSADEVARLLHREELISQMKLTHAGMSGCWKLNKRRLAEAWAARLVDFDLVDAAVVRVLGQRPLAIGGFHGGTA